MNWLFTFKNPSEKRPHCKKKFEEKNILKFVGTLKKWIIFSNTWELQKKRQYNLYLPVQPVQNQWRVADSWHKDPPYLKTSSFIRHKDFSPFFLLRNDQGTLPWILKRGGMETSGQRLISSISKTKRITFFFAKKKYFSNFQSFEKKGNFCHCLKILNILWIFVFFLWINFYFILFHFFF